ncbi:hypothetical protein RCL1_008058 [Eukaryota sp. TZLM3-RCL]
MMPKSTLCFEENGMSTFTEQLLPDKEEESKEGNSYFNEDEIMFLIQFLEKLYTFRRCPKSIQIAILCGYNAQRNKVLHPAAVLFDFKLNGDIHPRMLSKSCAHVYKFNCLT